QELSGELAELARRSKTGTGPLEAVPSMIVQPGSSRVSQPFVQLPPRDVLDLSSNVLPDSWMIDPNTDLLRGHRLRSIRNAAIALCVVAAATGVIFVIANWFGEANSRNI